MQNKYGKQKDEYGTVFDFIFGAQSTKRNKPVPKIDPKNDVYASALLEIGSQGAIYPLTSAFGDINAYIGKVTSIDIGNGITAGIGSGALQNSNKYSQKEISKNRAIATWASIGGSLQYGIDSALVSLWARNNGIDPKVAFEVGQLYRDVKKKELSDKASAGGIIDVFGYMTPKEKEEENMSFRDRSIDLRLDMIDNLPTNLKGDLRNEILNLQSTTSKEQRIRETAEFLKQRGLDIRLGAQIAYSVWGKIGSKDYGLYANDPAYYANLARKTTNLVLAKNLRDSLLAQGKNVDMNEIQERINSILGNDKTTLGMRASRIALGYNWLSQSGGWSALFLAGKWEKLGVDDINFTKIVQPMNVYKIGANGKKEKVGSYFDGADSVMGKLLGKYYYLHPSNFFRGVFLDGSLLLKWASKNGVVDTKNFFYLLYNVRLGKLLEGVAKPMQLLSTGIQKLLNPLMVGIKNFLRKSLTTLLGATGLAGLAINFIINVVSDKLIYILNQIVIIVVLTIFGILFLLFGGGASSTSTQDVQSLVNSNNQSSVSQESTGSSIFTDSDITISK